MLTTALYLSSMLHLLTSAAAAAAAAAEPPVYTPIDYFLLNCGSSSNSTSPDGRSWDGDARSKFSPPNIDAASSASTASEQDPAVTQIPFMTARIFHSRFTYTFPVSGGPKFVRLYFYPATYAAGLDTTKSFLSVTSGVHTLLSNYSAFLTVSAMKPQQTSLIKEFIVNIGNNTQRLEITFVPSPKSFAFVNGIEVVSMPDNLYMRREVPLVGYKLQQPIAVDESTALETLHRLNVGGSDVARKGDTGMYRTWRQDDPYILGRAFGTTPQRDVPIHYTNDTPAYTAPAIVYTTSRTMGAKPEVDLNYNLTWTFTVDSGFYYLVRLHFCEIQLEVTHENQRIFKVFLNNQTADEEVDVIHLTGGTGIPVFKDYIVLVPPAGDRPTKQDLWLQLYPNMDSKPSYADVLLNGLEIFKFNKSDGSLAGPNPEPVSVVKPPTPDPKITVYHRSKVKSSVLAIVGGVIGGIVVVLLILGILIYRRRMKARSSGVSVEKASWVTISATSKSTNTTTTSSLPANLCRHLSLAEIKSATRNFNEDFAIGKGGFGNVYKGYIDNGALTVAIKRLNPSSNQGAREFQTEIQTLSKLRHVHLVSLIGYCDDDGEMILVYDFMARGTLRDHLYGTNNPPLTWKQRLLICIGAARGLHYLHTGAKQTIIHRDVKSTNILLDEKWVAKVSDFGLSKMGPSDLNRSHVSTVVKGSFGYVDPEYYRRQQLTDKSDVYSFGVVLLEALCGRPAIITGLPKEQVSLAAWGRYRWRKGAVDRIVDPNLRGQIAPECLRKFGETADSCLRDVGIERPTMSDVVWSLEFALQLQEVAERNIDGGHGFGTAMSSPSVPLLPVRKSTTTDDDDYYDEVFSGSKSSTGTSTAESGGKSGSSRDVAADDRLRSESIFSEILHPKGR